MKMKKMQLLWLVGCIIFPTLLHAQQQSKFNWINVIPWVIALAALFFTIYRYFKEKRDKRENEIAKLEAEDEFKRKKRAKKEMTDEEIYHAALKEELGHIDLLGSPDIESKAVKLEDAFVSLCISQTWRSEERFTKRKEMMDLEMERELPLTPAEAMTRAFKKYRLLLVIGDPGSGKTTLLKYYAVNCLNKKYREFGFKDDVFPIYFPLRELDFNKENNEPVLLPQNLEKWSKRHLLNISEQQFYDWLHKRKTLVLLDGLDEISSKEQRRKVCRWIKDMCTGLKNACFVMTSRATGYRKLDGIELKMPHLRADIMDFTIQQQEEFLKRWFRAVFLSSLQPEGMAVKEWKEKQLKLADQRSQPIIDFLKKEENKAVQELAAVPMLMQIMAILWKDRKNLPDSRPALYDAALNYLLAYRDKEKDIEPLLPVEKSRLVLAPTALWMQEKLQKDEAPKEAMHQKMQPILNTLDKNSRHPAVVFCDYLRDRAGLIADYDKEHYIFRHKSFREFLAGIRLKEEAHKQKQERINNLVKHFKDDWWEETLRFFMSKVDDEIFDRFMRAFFKSKISQELNAHQQNLLQNLVKEAPQKKIDALKDHLNSDSLNSHQRRYIMDCLKTIGTPEALKALETSDKEKLSKENLSYAGDIIAEASAKDEIIEEKPVKIDLVSERPASFRNPFEDNVEYIKIPGAKYKFSVTEEMVTVPDLYFCKYPVTNKRYRRFISFLANKEKELEKKLSLDIFGERLLEFAGTIKGYTEDIEKDFNQWQSKLRSSYDDDKKFNGDDQPVVGISWYAARSYCFWLSCLETVINQGRKIEDVKQVADIYRLPTEEEWEWAAGGNPDGSMQTYPWAKEKGEPNSKLSNYDNNVGTTTPVGRYPEGATLQGLMDMAGNVWEWMENYYDEDKDLLALRGGSWLNDDGSLVCSYRASDVPGVYWGYGVGFRVVRSLPPVI